MLERKEDLISKSQSIALLVLNCLKSPYPVKNMIYYLDEARKVSRKRRDDLATLLESVKTVSQDKLVALICFLIDFKLSPDQTKYSYLVKGVAFENQSEI